MALSWLSGSGSAADPISWRTEYSAARKEAEQANLPLLIVVGTERCMYCKKQETETFADVRTQEFVKGRLIPLKVDASREREFVKAMQLTLYPTTIIAGPDGRVYAYLAGFQPTDQFLEHAKKAIALMPGNSAPSNPDARAATLAKGVRTNSGSTSVAPPPTDASGLPKEERTARELLDAVRAAYNAGRYADCLDRADALAAAFPESGEAREVAALVAEIAKDDRKLASTYQQLDERTASRYYRIGDSLAHAGRLAEAVEAFEKSLRASPTGKSADATRARLTALYDKLQSTRAGGRN